MPPLQSQLHHLLHLSHPLKERAGLLAAVEGFAWYPSQGSLASKHDLVGREAILSQHVMMEAKRPWEGFHAI